MVSGRLLVPGRLPQSLVFANDALTRSGAARSGNRAAAPASGWRLRAPIGHGEGRPATSNTEGIRGDVELSDPPTRPRRSSPHGFRRRASRPVRVRSHRGMPRPDLRTTVRVQRPVSDHHIAKLDALATTVELREPAIEASLETGVTQAEAGGFKWVPEPLKRLDPSAHSVMSLSITSEVISTTPAPRGQQWKVPD
jgi:hypothetical protein